MDYKFLLVIFKFPFSPKDAATKYPRLQEVFACVDAVNIKQLTIVHIKANTAHLL